MQRTLDPNTKYACKRIFVQSANSDICSYAICSFNLPICFSNIMFSPLSINAVSLRLYIFVLSPIYLSHSLAQIDIARGRSEEGLLSLHPFACTFHATTIGDIIRVARLMSFHSLLNMFSAMLTPNQ